MVDAEHKFVFELDFKLQNTLATMLDVSDAWEALASFLQMPSGDVDLCRQEPSPSATVLRVWSARGYSINHIYLVLATIRHKRAMQLIEDKVTPKYLATAKKYEEAVDIPENEMFSVAGTSDISLIKPDQHHYHHHHHHHQQPQQQQQYQQTPIQGVRSTLNQLQLHPSTAGKNSTNQHSAAAELSSDTNVPRTSSTVSSTATSSSHVSTLQNTMGVRYSELYEATHEFASDAVIGRGGYGIVYKGVWKHTTVAIKRIICKASDTAGTEHEKERLRQSLVELKAMALYRHDNVLPLYGYSLDGAEPCLIYQYMAGGSLEDRILCRHNRTPLTWAERVHCMLGAARGLNFLHTITAQPLIHGDIKSANILCDQHLCAKIGDFGLCRMGQPELADNVMPLIASHIKGTLAYLPPEFLRNKRLSTKLDVYSFGVVLLEVATGERSYSTQRKPEQLAAFIANKYALNGSSVDNLLEYRDSKADTDTRGCFQTFISTGIRCCQADPADRPTMGQLIGDIIDKE